MGGPASGVKEAIVGHHKKQTKILQSDQAIVNTPLNINNTYDHHK